ncbi:release factor [Saccharata proteae CBS 121410]|uniref:Release factor n=1 Tax=Saccharata proteae CBS 121410 TaxID=1314787 RepID=A0A9P4HZE3_9PEZI|nr:release factor [Saccharata proteae CBS 121410]
MQTSAWVCRRCLSKASRPLIRQSIRWQSTNTSESISPALLSRARSIAAEHDQLTKKLAENFDINTAKRIGEISRVADALKEWDRAEESLTELRGLLNDPNADTELRDLAVEDLTSTSAQVAALTRSLKASLVPKHPFAHLPCLLEIRPGAGGSEAAIFAGDLVRMYIAYCMRTGLRCNTMKYESAEAQSGANAPVVEAILEIESDGAYGQLRSEAGVHRVQRVPATETKGRTHTSAASVMVLPSFPANGNTGDLSFDDPNSDYYIDPKEVKSEVMRAGGAGGQHVNKTESAVRLTHLPTGTTVMMSESRSQPRNREKAWQVLRSRIAQARREAREEEVVQLRRSVIGVAKTGRENKIRTYNWGQQRVTDHRSGLTLNNLDDVIKGGDSLEQVMESVRVWFSEKEVEELAALEEAKKPQTK